NFFHRIDNGVHIFLKRVVDAVWRRDLTRLIIDSQSAADIHVLDIQTAFPEGRVNTSDLLHSLLQVLNIQNLTAQMKVEKFETIGHTARGDFLNHPHQFRYSDPELRRIASRGSPLS